MEKTKKMTASDIIDEFYLDEVKGFHKEINGEITFYGVLFNEKAWNIIRADWIDATAKKYVGEYIHYAIPLGLNEKPLKDYKKDEFEKLFEKILRKRIKEKRTRHEKRMYEFKYRIAAVTNGAYEAGLCPDVLWGSQYQFRQGPEDDGEKAEEECVKLMKSLKIGEEIRLAEEVLTNPAQRGEIFGVALMYCLGLRPNEAVAVSFGDIHHLKGDTYVLYIYKSSDKDTRVSKMSGKTANASRIIPIPKRLLWLINERKKYICATEHKTGRQIITYPIVCKGDDFRCQCRPSEIEYYGTQLLRGASVDGDMLMYIDRAISEERNLEPGVIEKDPTAYLFRRNLATHLYILGLTENEIQYILGHDIEDVNDERHFFRNEEKLLMIAEKMAQRPIVNEIGPESYEVDGPHFYCDNIVSGTVHIKKRKTKYNLNMRVNQKEPYDKTTIRFSEGVEGLFYKTPNDNAYDEVVNIILTYQERYRSAQNERDEKKESRDSSEETT